MGNEFTKILNYFMNCFLEIVYNYDEECVVCKEYVSKKELMLCNSCMNMIKVCNDPYNMSVNNHHVSCYSGVYYSGIVKELISRLKYKSDFKAGEVLSAYMLQAIKDDDLKFDIVTYVPSTRKTLKKRGYNQSEFLAKTIGKKTDTKVLGLLSKVKETKDQIGLSGEERWENLRNSYKVNKVKDIRDKIILLVDDVITTGATGFFCAEDMLKNGAKQVYILTAAKSSI